MKREAFKTKLSWVHHQASKNKMAAYLIRSPPMAAVVIYSSNQRIPTAKNTKLIAAVSFLLLCI